MVSLLLQNLFLAAATLGRIVATALCQEGLGGSLATAFGRIIAAALRRSAVIMPVFCLGRRRTASLRTGMTAARRSLVATAGYQDQ